ncbi:sigma-70 family RNA polymerase sigma factor [Isosphaeraceae bacterium EP7]
MDPDLHPPTPIDWAASLAEHGRWLRTVLRARLGHPQAVEEVLQEVALAAVARREPLADPARVGAWLYRLALRQALMYRRGLGRRIRLVERYASLSEVDTSGRPDPLGWLLADERKRAVREALARLPPRDAEILLLKYTENWSARALADHLGVSPNAVDARLHRSRARLRQELARSSVIEVPE